MNDTKKVITIPSAPPKMVLLNCKVDLTKMCRTCGEKCKGTVSLFKSFKTSKEEIKISKMLTMCTSLKVQLGDGLPMIICFDCMNDLIEVHQFIEKCKTTDIKMRKYVFEDNVTYINDAPNNNTYNNITYNNYTYNKTIQYNTTCKSSKVKTETVKKNLINIEKQKVKTARRKNPVKVIEALRNKINPDKDILFNEQFEINLPSLNISDSEINDDSIKSEDIIIDKNKNDLKTELLFADYGYEIEEIVSNCDVIETKKNECNKEKMKTESDAQESTGNNISDEIKRTLYRWVKDCPYCSKTFYKFETYKTHIKLHAGILPFKCDLCPKEYAKSGRLIEHKKLKHPENPNLKYTCRRSDCKVTFASWQEMQEHNKTHIKNYYECKICDKTFTYRKGYNKHRKMHLGIHDKFPCEICGKIMQTQSSLYMHRRNHKKEYSVLCTLCGKGFLTPIGLRKHTMGVHSDKKLFQCEICGKGLKTLSSLNFHKLAFHVQIRNISCQLCPRKFIKRSQLNQHMKRHNKEYRFTCDICDHQFYIKRDLEVHQMIHTGERPLKCIKCPKTYTRPQLYRQHMARHVGPYTQCDICYSFLRPDYFDKHRMGHDNKKKRDENDFVDELSEDYDEY